MNEGLGIKLPYEVTDAITLATLQDSLRAIQENIATLREQPSLEKYQREDLDNNLVLASCMVPVIEYYGG